MTNFSCDFDADGININCVLKDMSTKKKDIFLIPTKFDVCNMKDYTCEEYNSKEFIFDAGKPVRHRRDDPRKYYEQKSDEDKDEKKKKKKQKKRDDKRDKKKKKSKKKRDKRRKRDRDDD